MKVGRNDPCPCGSGRKYKRCCINDRFPGERRPQPITKDGISPSGIGDYGAPTPDDSFFKSNPFKEFSAQRLLYSCLVRPEIESLASHMVKQGISRGKEEEGRIRETNDVLGLIALMKQDLDPLNHRLLMYKVLQHAKAAAPVLIDEMRQDQRDSFYELAIRIMYELKIDCSPGLQKLVLLPLNNLYALSLTCMLLGMLGRGYAMKPLWDCYHFFKERHPDENYSDGPLVGLHDLARKHDLLQNIGR